MIYYILATALVSVIGIFTFASFSQKPNSNQSANGNDTIPGNDTNVTVPVDTPKNKLYTKEELFQKLNYLSKTPAPKELKEGAMCYKPAGPPNSIDYICPSCGAKTVYSTDQSWFLWRDLQACRSMVKNLKGLNATLDETTYCKKCNKTKATPELCLIIHYPDKTEQRTCGVNRTSMMYLQEFLSGSLKHHSETNAEFPLKDNINEIEKMLGISLKK
ncbi:MAG: hypothetical protein V2A54_16890 [Bacteroidota bacterium]